MDQRFASASQICNSSTGRATSQPGLRRAVHACLSLGVRVEELDEDGWEEGDSESLRESLFELVVRPLEEDLEGAYGAAISTKSLDEEAASKIWLPYSLALNPTATDSGGIDTPKPPSHIGHHRQSSLAREPSPSLPRQPGLTASLRDPEPLTLFNIDTKAAR